MLSKKPQTIQGFLSPHKLLSGVLKNTKSKGTKSPISSHKKSQHSNSHFNSQNQSFLNTSRQIQKQQFNQTGSIQILKDKSKKRLTNQRNIISSSQPIQDKKYDSDTNVPFTFDPERRNNFNQVYKKVNQSIEQQEQQYNSNQNRVLSEVNRQRWATEKSQSQVFSQVKLKNEPSANIRQNLTSKPSLSEGVYSNIKSNNAQVMTVQCYELIRKLSKIKENLQLQILELQTLLDNTSKYMENMDEEFEKIKDSILQYTARCLDNAFTEYKQNMAEWQKYEDFERKSLTMLSQINEYIYNEEQKLSASKELSSRQVSSVAHQLQRQIVYYRQFTEEIKKIRQQCVNMRPTLSEDRIKAFEKGVDILCSF